MTLEEFLEVIEHRIPTAQEFVAFALARRWRFEVTAGAAVLFVTDAKDPFARGFARMLAREPYRTRVLEHLAQLGLATSPPPPMAAEPRSEKCWLCLRTVDPATAAEECRPEHRPADYTLVNTDGTRTHADNPPCHYRKSA